MDDNKIQLTEMVCDFCQEKLDDDCKNDACDIIDKIFVMEDVSFKKESIQLWASAIIYIAGQKNSYFIDDSQYDIKIYDICVHFKTIRSTVLNKAKKIQESIKLINTNIEDDEDEFFAEIIELFDLGKHNVALKRLDVIDEDSPYYMSSLLYKSILLPEIQQYERADEAFEQFVSLLIENPSEKWESFIFDDEVAELGFKSFEKGDFAQAVKFFDFALKLGSNQSKVLFLKASALFSLNEIDDAKLTIDKAIKLNSNKSKYWSLKADLYSPRNFPIIPLKDYDDIDFQNDSREAIRCYKEALNLNPDSYYPLIGLAKVYAGLGDFDNASSYLDKVPKHHWDDLDYLLTCGQLQVLELNLDEALKYFDECIKRYSQFAIAWLYKGMIFAMKSDYDNSLKYMHKAVKLDSSLENMIDCMIKEYLENK